MKNNMKPTNIKKNTNYMHTNLKQRIMKTRGKHNKTTNTKHIKTEK